ncbi:Protein PRY2 [Tolypocladium ophioglossoides CBS 100239]|uniref:Protein PRY2 n=1 Tax=Tolypocladium ophioglossoides (strain CBS 100239) TaxID=1163406 RepID=A0A0L0NMG3_TOLOC|nr:Protein PRY2 [Tolypocladium ophioglossoides CBS 100239]
MSPANVLSTSFKRSEHDASDVSWDDTLADFASDYLDDNGCKFQHLSGPCVKNLAITHSNATASVEGWDNERQSTISDFMRNTTDADCERKLCGESRRYLVCEYRPSGNIIGEFDEVDKDKGAATLARSRIYHFDGCGYVCSLRAMMRQRLELQSE